MWIDLLKTTRRRRQRGRARQPIAVAALIAALASGFSAPPTLVVHRHLGDDTAHTHVAATAGRARPPHAHHHRGDAHAPGHAHAHEHGDGHRHPHVHGHNHAASERRSRLDEAPALQPGDGAGRAHWHDEQPFALAITDLPLLIGGIHLAWPATPGEHGSAAAGAPWVQRARGPPASRRIPDISPL